MILMIISPSKTQDFNDPLDVETSLPLLLLDSNLLIRELQRISVTGLADLMKMSERLALQTAQRIKDFVVPFTLNNARPAIGVFQGDVYLNISVDKYGKEEIVYMRDHLRILSGLYGILRPFDLMQAYRLEMGCKLENGRGKNLYEFWGERITEEVNRILSNHSEPILVDLASAEYSRVIKKKDLKGTVLKIDFKERKGDAYRTVAIHAKRARGMMVDFAVRNRVEQVTELKDFQDAEYCFNPELSSEEHYCFTRD